MTKKDIHKRNIPEIILDQETGLLKYINGEVVKVMGMAHTGMESSGEKNKPNPRVPMGPHYFWGNNAEELAFAIKRDVLAIDPDAMPSIRISFANEPIIYSDESDATVSNTNVWEGVDDSNKLCESDPEAQGNSIFAYWGYTNSENPYACEPTKKNYFDSLISYAKYMSSQGIIPIITLHSNWMGWGTEDEWQGSNAKLYEKAGNNSEPAVPIETYYSHWERVITALKDTGAIFELGNEMHGYKTPEEYVDYIETLEEMLGRAHAIAPDNVYIIPGTSEYTSDDGTHYSTAWGNNFRRIIEKGMNIPEGMKVCLAVHPYGPDVTGKENPAPRYDNPEALEADYNATSLDAHTHGVNNTRDSSNYKFCIALTEIGTSVESFGQGESCVDNGSGISLSSGQNMQCNVDIFGDKANIIIAFDGLGQAHDTTSFYCRDLCDLTEFEPNSDQVAFFTRMLAQLPSDVNSSMTSATFATSGDTTTLAVTTNEGTTSYAVSSSLMPTTTSTMDMSSSTTTLVTEEQTESTTSGAQFSDTTGQSETSAGFQTSVDNTGTVSSNIVISSEEENVKSNGAKEAEEDKQARAARDVAMVAIGMGVTAVTGLTGYYLYDRYIKKESNVIEEDDGIVALDEISIEGSHDNVSYSTEVDGNDNYEHPTNDSMGAGEESSSVGKVVIFGPSVLTSTSSESGKDSREDEGLDGDFDSSLFNFGFMPPFLISAIMAAAGVTAYYNRDKIFGSSNKANTGGRVLQSALEAKDFPPEVNEFIQASSASSRIDDPFYAHMLYFAFQNGGKAAMERVGYLINEWSEYTNANGGVERLKNSALDSGWRSAKSGFLNGFTNTLMLNAGSNPVQAAMVARFVSAVASPSTAITQSIKSGLTNYTNSWLKEIGFENVSAVINAGLKKAGADERWTPYIVNILSMTPTVAMNAGLISTAPTFAAVKIGLDALAMQGGHNIGSTLGSIAGSEVLDGLESLGKIVARHAAYACGRTYDAATIPDQEWCNEKQRAFLEEWYLELEGGKSLSTDIQKHNKTVNSKASISDLEIVSDNAMLLSAFARGSNTYKRTVTGRS